MGFRSHKLRHFDGASLCLVKTTRTNEETGEIEVVEQNASEINLPDPSTFDIEVQLKSGIPMQKVNTKILGAEKEVNDYLDHLEQTQASSPEYKEE